MTEAVVVRKILNILKKQMPKARIFKHNDLSTAGIPDISITWGQKLTTWVEVKLLDDNETYYTFRKKIDSLQLAQAILLQREGRCLYLIAYFRDKKLEALLIEPNVLAQRHESLSVTDLSVVSIFNGPFELTIEHLMKVVRT